MRSMPKSSALTRSCAGTPRSRATATRRFVAPKTAWGIRGRNRLLGSRAFGLMMRYGDKAANDIDLADYPALAGARPEHG
jgi:hypothetical protein